MASRLPNIDNLSLKELKDLASRVQAAMTAKNEEGKAATLNKLKALAATDGYSLDELLGKAPGGGRRQRSDKGVKL
ncbi:MAG: hypothetical protein EON93_21035, partial [Burkholderiales bacterium]